MKKLFFAAAFISLAAFGCKPTQYDVNRETVINAPIESIFDQVNIIKNQEAWSPWERMDPNMTRTYEGPEAGVDALYKWTGNDSVGTGSMLLTSSNFPDSIGFSLTFTSPWESTSDIYWTFTPSEGGIKVVWGNRGELPGYLFWMSESDMDEAMGKEFERGLSQLKEIVEAMKPATPDYGITQTEVESKTIYGITEDISWEEMNSDFFGSRYGEIVALLKQDAANLSAPPLAVYHKWDEENKRAIVEVALACESKIAGNKRIVKRASYAGPVLKASFMGPYEGTGAVHEAIYSYVESNGLQMAGSPWESYVTDPATEPDTLKWLTEVYYPIAPAATAEN